eukprot:scaffold10879_cov1210-Chaetoceros_neogracile.AAC.1
MQLNDETQSKLRDTPVEFKINADSTNNGSRAHEDYVYQTMTKTVGEVACSITCDIDSIYGTFPCLHDIFHCLQSDSLHMTRNFSTIPTGKTRLSVKIPKPVPQKGYKLVNLGGFQTMEFGQTKVRGITFHITAVLVDMEKFISGHIGMAMKKINAMIIIIAANIARMLVLGDLNIHDLVDNMCSYDPAGNKNDEDEYNNEVSSLFELANTVAERLTEFASRDNNARQTQHWLSNCIFGIHIPSKYKNSYVQCANKQATHFAGLFDSALKMMSFGLFAKNPSAFEKFLKSMIPASWIPIKNGSNTAPEQAIIAEFALPGSNKLQNCAKYINKHLMFHLSAAGIKHLLPNHSFEIQVDAVQVQENFNRCRGELVETLESILCVDALQEHTKHLGTNLYADLGFTFDLRDEFKYSLVTPHGTKSNYVAMTDVEIDPHGEEISHNGIEAQQERAQVHSTNNDEMLGNFIAIEVGDENTLGMQEDHILLESSGNISIEEVEHHKDSNDEDSCEEFVEDQLDEEYNPIALQREIRSSSIEHNKEPHSAPSIETAKYLALPPHSPMGTEQSNELEESAHDGIEPMGQTRGVAAATDSATASLPASPIRQYALEVLGEECLQNLEGTEMTSAHCNEESMLSKDSDAIASKPKSTAEDGNQMITDTSNKDETEPDSIHFECKHDVADNSKPSITVEDLFNQIHTEVVEKDEEKKIVDASVEGTDKIGTEANESKSEEKTVAATLIHTEAVEKDEEKKVVDAFIEGTDKIGTEANESKSEEKRVAPILNELISDPSIANEKKVDQKQAEAMSTSEKQVAPNGVESSNPSTEAKQSEPEATGESQDVAKVQCVALSEEHKERKRTNLAKMKDLPCFWKEIELNDERLTGGWSLLLCKRLTGNKKTADKYWFTPTGLRLRSNPEVSRFLKALKSCNGDEDLAHSVAVKKKATPTKTKKATPTKTQKATPTMKKATATMKKTMPSTKKTTPTKRKAPADKNTSVTKQKLKNSVLLESSGNSSRNDEHSEDVNMQSINNEPLEYTRELRNHDVGSSNDEVVDDNNNELDYSVDDSTSNEWEDCGKSESEWEDCNVDDSDEDHITSHGEEVELRKDSNDDSEDFVEDHLDEEYNPNADDEVNSEDFVDESAVKNALSHPMDEYELFFNPKMAGRHSGTIKSTWSTEPVKRLVYKAMNESYPALVGGQQYCSGAREAKAYYKCDLNILQWLPAVVRHACLQDDPNLDVWSQDILDKSVKVLKDMAEFRSVRDLGNRSNLLLRLEYYYAIECNNIQASHAEVPVEQSPPFCNTLFSMEMSHLLAVKVEVASSKMEVCHNYYRTLEKARLVILDFVSEIKTGTYRIDSKKSFIVSASLIFASEILAYGPGTRSGAQIPWPLMRKVRKMLNMSLPLFFPESEISGVSVKMPTGIQTSISFGLDATLLEISHNAKRLISLILDKVEEQHKNALDWINTVHQLTSETLSINIGGNVKLSKQKLHALRLMAFQSSIQAINEEGKLQLFEAKDDEVNTMIVWEALIKALARVFFVSYLTQAKEDLMSFIRPTPSVMKKMLVNGLAPCFETEFAMTSSHLICDPKKNITTIGKWNDVCPLFDCYKVLHNCDTITENFLSELFQGHEKVILSRYTKTSSDDHGNYDVDAMKKVSGWNDCLYFRVYTLILSLTMTAGKKIPNNLKHLTSPMYLHQMMIKQYVAASGNGTSILYKTQKKSRKGVHRRQQIQYIKVEGGVTRVAPIISRECVLRSLELDTYLTVDGKICMSNDKYWSRAVSHLNWITVDKLDFNPRQWICLAIITKSMIWNDSDRWIEHLGKIGALKALWGVLHGVNTISNVLSDNKKICDGMASRTTLQQIASCGICSMFPDFRSFSDTYTNIHKNNKSKSIKNNISDNEMNDRYESVYVMLLNFQITEETSFDIKNKILWSQGTSKFFSSLAEKCNGLRDCPSKKKMDQYTEDIIGEINLDLVKDAQVDFVVAAEDNATSAPDSPYNIARENEASTPTRE